MIGFTAWSASREPTQVFTLLETIYNSFDVIAKRRGVFKVSHSCSCSISFVSSIWDANFFRRDCRSKLWAIVTFVSVVFPVSTTSYVQGAMR